VEVPRYAAWRSKASRFLHADITDRVAMARLRARVIWVLALLAIAAQTSAWAGRPSTVATGWPVMATLTGVLAITVVVAALRGHRLGDRAFVVLILGNQLSAVTAVDVINGGGQVSEATVSLMTAMLLGALFCGRRRQVAVVAVSTVGMIVATASTASSNASSVGDVTAGAFTVIAVSAIVRVLRDLAITAVDQARRGEVTDPLTGLGNRRGLERAGGPYWADHARGQHPIAVLVIDVDHFKQINDTQGHAGGDEVLRRLAALVSGSLRAGDVAVRLGGEEFLVLCSIPPDQAQRVAERLRRSVEENLAPVTVSIGVHVTTPTDQDLLPTSIWTAVNRADQALYAAKNSGRNRVALTE
jgi:diguanylate cyclase (GGDEF)-like protein